MNLIPYKFCAFPCYFTFEILGFLLCEMGMVMIVILGIKTLLSVTIGMDSGFSVKIYVYKFIQLYLLLIFLFLKSLKNYLQLSYLFLWNSWYYIFLKTVLEMPFLKIEEKKISTFSSKRSQSAFMWNFLFQYIFKNV